MDLFAPATAAPGVATGTATAAELDAPAPTTADLGPVHPNRLQRLGGAALIAAPLLFTGGMLTSPEQTAPGTAGYIESLAANPALSLWSANLLHYGWVALAFGAIATIGLLRGRRGRVFLPIAAALVMFGAIQMSGLLLSDWFLISAGNTLAIEDAVLLGMGLLSLALARAKAISWWIAPLGFLPWVVPAFGLGPVGVIVALACYAPLLVAGVRLVAAK